MLLSFVFIEHTYFISFKLIITSGNVETSCNFKLLNFCLMFLRKFFSLFLIAKCFFSERYLFPLQCLNDWYVIIEQELRF